MTLRGEAGSALAETVIAVMLFSALGTAVLAGVSTLYSSGARTESQAIAEQVARSQMERVFASSYLSPPANYPTVDVPAGYGVEAVAQPYGAGDPRLERVVVRVSHAGREVLVLETLRSQP
ncbi:MAG: hypothetical protein ACK4K2_00885 [Dehalococcoidia bacterium]